MTDTLSTGLLKSLFAKYLSNQTNPSIRNEFPGPLGKIDFTDSVLGEAIEGIRDAINGKYAENISRIQTPQGQIQIYMDYVKSDHDNAFSTFGGGIAFIGLTTTFIKRIIQISSQLWRLDLLSDILKIQLDRDTRNHIAATSIPILIQIASNHELGHLFHGHCGEPAAPRLKAENSDRLNVQGVDQSRKMRGQAMEVEADGYAVHLMLTNFFNGIGHNLYSMFNSGLSEAEFILAYFVVELGSLFYVQSPQFFDEHQVRLYDHPPALMRLNVFMRDIEGWCGQYESSLVEWGTLARFQEIMRAVSMADVDADSSNVWQRQGKFLLSLQGKQYIDDLYKAREGLREEMTAFRWHLTPLTQTSG